jgi:hypothetical protein
MSTAAEPASERIGTVMVEPITMRPDRPIPAWQFTAWELIVPRLPLRVMVLLGRVFGRLPLRSRARLTDIELLGIPRGSDGQVTLEETHVYTFRAGAVIEVREFRTKTQALEAVGLRG